MKGPFAIGRMEGKLWIKMGWEEGIGLDQNEIEGMGWTEEKDQVDGDGE